MIRNTPLFSKLLSAQRCLILLRTGRNRITAATRSTTTTAAESGSKVIGRGRQTYRKGVSVASAGVGLAALGTFAQLDGVNLVCCDSSDGLDPIITTIKDFATNTVVPWTEEHGFSGVLGFCSGVAIKRIGTTVIAAIGGVILVAQCLQYSGYIEIDYTKIKRDINKVISKEKKQGNMEAMLKHVVERVNSVLLLHVPDSANYVAGACLGFYLA